MKSGINVTKTQMVAMENAVTKELEYAKVTINVQRDVPKYKTNFVVLFQAVNIATAKNIKPVTAKLLLYLVAIVDYQNLITKSSEDLAEELGYKIRNVQIALKELEDLKIITRTQHTHDKRSSNILLNPYQSWKGTVKERAEFMQVLQDKNQLEIPFKEFLKPKKMDALKEAATNAQVDEETQTPYDSNTGEVLF